MSEGPGNGVLFSPPAPVDDPSTTACAMEREKSTQSAGEDVPADNVVKEEVTLNGIVDDKEGCGARPDSPADEDDQMDEEDEDEDIPEEAADSGTELQDKVVTHLNPKVCFLKFLLFLGLYVNIAIEESKFISDSLPGAGVCRSLFLLHDVWGGVGS